LKKKQGEELTNREKLELKVHLAGCYICRVYEDQSIMISALVRNLLKPDATAEIRLDDDYKNELKQRINNKINEQN
jgi:hypothetical protein